MPTRSLPPRPSLDQLRRQAKELRSALHERSIAAAARMVAHHPRMKSLSPTAVLDAPPALADAQLVVAREYGFSSWAALKHRVELARRLENLRPHPRFSEALEALDAGDVDRLRALVATHPDLVHARTNLDVRHGYFAGATLLHHVAGNPYRDSPMSDNIVEIARVLLDAGADVEAATLGPNGGTTMGLLVTGAQASRKGLSGPLIDLLLRYGAKLDVTRPDALRSPLSNHATGAAEKLIELGAKPDLIAAAALGRMELLRSFFDEDGRLRSVPVRDGSPMRARDAVGLAFLFAYVRREAEAADFLLDKDGNWDVTGVNNGTALHRAAWDGDLSMVRRLVHKGADLSNRDNPFVSTPFAWAVHNRQHEVIDWIRSNCPIDLHDAVCMDLHDHVEARLREDPHSVNRRIDQWEIPQCAPLHWAVWPGYADIQGEHRFDPVRRETLVALLLECGADIDLVAGNGTTALDMARAGGLVGVVSLLEQRGARGASELTSAPG